MLCILQILSITTKQIKCTILIRCSNVMSSEETTDWLWTTLWQKTTWKINELLNQNISNTVAKDRNTGVSIGVLGEKQSLNLGLKIDQLKVIYGKVTVVTGRIIEIESFAKRFGCVAFTCEL